MCEVFSDNFCQILVQFHISRSQLNIFLCNFGLHFLENYSFDLSGIFCTYSLDACWMAYSQWHLITETDHQPKVQTVSPSLLNLSLNVLEGRRSISGNGSSSQSRNSFSFCSRPVPKCPWRTEIHQRQQIIIAKYKHFLLRFSTCPSICLKDGDPSAATDHHLDVETMFRLPLDLSLHFL